MRERERENELSQRNAESRTQKREVRCTTAAQSKSCDECIFYTPESCSTPSDSSWLPVVVVVAATPLQFWGVTVSKTSGSSVFDELLLSSCSCLSFGMNVCWSSSFGFGRVTVSRGDILTSASSNRFTAVIP